jgi:hypothetical protein
MPIKKAIVRDSRFEPVAAAAVVPYAAGAISMNYGTAAGDTQPRDPIVVYDFNAVAGDTFRVFYGNDVPPSSAACSDTRAGVAGYVCRGDGAGVESRR